MKKTLRGNTPEERIVSSDVTITENVEVHWEFTQDVKKDINKRNKDI